jgi:hypothetical protein
MRGNPSGNLVPECEPRKGVSWRLTELDARTSATIRGNADTGSLVLDSIFYTKPFGFAQGGNQKSYLQCAAASWGAAAFWAQFPLLPASPRLGLWKGLTVFADRSVRATRAILLL